MDMRIRKSMKQNKGKLFGIVEADETYVGGKEKNKHWDKRTKGTRGRSTQTKAPVMGLIQRGGEVRVNVVDDVKIPTIEQKILKHVKMGSKLYTDDFLPYARIGRLYLHEVVQHGRGQYVRAGNIHSNSIESFWALFKRGYHGVYHHMSKKHLQRYVDEFSYRFNEPTTLLQETFASVVQRVSNTSELPYKVLTK